MVLFHHIIETIFSSLSHSIKTCLAFALMEQCRPQSTSSADKWLCLQVKSFFRSRDVASLRQGQRFVWSLVCGFDEIKNRPFFALCMTARRLRSTRNAREATLVFLQCSVLVSEALRSVLKFKCPPNGTPTVACLQIRKHSVASAVV